MKKLPFIHRPCLTAPRSVGLPGGTYIRHTDKQILAGKALVASGNHGLLPSRGSVAAWKLGWAFHNILLTSEREIR